MTDFPLFSNNLKNKFPSTIKFKEDTYFFWNSKDISKRAWRSGKLQVWNYTETCRGVVKGWIYNTCLFEITGFRLGLHWFIFNSIAITPTGNFFYSFGNREKIYHYDYYNIHSVIKIWTIDMNIGFTIWF